MTLLTLGLAGLCTPAYWVHQPLSNRHQMNSKKSTAVKPKHKADILPAKSIFQPEKGRFGRFKVNWRSALCSTRSAAQCFVVEDK